MKKRQVVLSPHLDDAVFSCWSKVLQEKSAVVTVFGGVPPAGMKRLWDFLCGQADSAKMSMLRHEENARVLSEIGAKNITLGYLDHQYAQSLPDRDAVVSELLNMCDAEVYFVPMAAAKHYRHPDHVFVRELGLELQRRGKKVIFYADRPYMVVPHIPHDHYLTAVKNELDMLLGGSYRVWADAFSTEDAQRKIQAMKAYKTQFFMTNLTGFGSLGRVRSMRHEVFAELEAD